MCLHMEFNSCVRLGPHNLSHIFLGAPGSTRGLLNSFDRRDVKWKIGWKSTSTKPHLLHRA